MKDQINLLPPAAKHSRIRRLYRTRALYLARRVGVGVMIIWVVMAGIGYLTWQRQQDLRGALAAQNQNGSEVFQEVARVNQLMSLVNQRVETYPAITPVLDDIVQALPAAARLTVLALQADTGGLVVKGISSSRAAVLDMQRQLEALAWVERLEAPLQNFAVDSSGEFSFTLFRKLEK